ncbi:MAG: UDP-N-acetylglucosamine 1-carboxyvinyltransferase [Dehalococcoidia bacterium]|nr:MAG: UDP-N-acetylglucosamine 1-carboxyvinyltransferase [Dehalococcoidia bacterium]
MPADRDRYVIRGGRPLHGEVTVSGSKNAALYALAAALLTPDTVTLRNVPRIADIEEMAAVLRALGADVTIAGETVTLRAAEFTTTVAPADLVAKLRASFLVVGALLARTGEATCVSPGGDVIGSRPLDVHFTGFKALGATVEELDGQHVVRAQRLGGARIFFDYPSVLGTVNVLFAATRAHGHTTIINAAAEPEVEMVAEMLCGMGAQISGHGSATIEVDGVSRLGGTEFSIIADRLEAGTYLLAGVATGGDVRVPNARPEHMDSLIAKLREIGVDVDASNGIRARCAGVLGVTQVQAVPYPGFPTDLQAPMTAALLRAPGVSTVHERVYERRFNYTTELARLGARIEVGDNGIATIHGGAPLTGTAVEALDIRAGAAVVVAGLAAAGETVVGGLRHLDRGYADLEPRLRALGADITRVAG